MPISEIWLHYLRQIFFFTVSLSNIIFFSQNQSKEIFFEKNPSPPPPPEYQMDRALPVRDFLSEPEANYYGFSSLICTTPFTGHECCLRT